MEAYMARLILTALVVMSALCGSWAFAQQGTAALNGQVADPSGFAVVGAKVQATNAGTNNTYLAETNEAGLYDFPTLPPGTYQVTASKEGFQQLVRPGVELHVSDVITLNFPLQVGSVNQSVTVEGGAPLVETTSSEIGGLVNDRKIADLPLNGRNYIDLSLLQAGVTQNTNVGSMAGMGGTAYSSNGISMLSNNFLLDGTSIVNQTGWGSSSFAGTTLGVDGIKEYKVLTSVWDASYGMAMGSQMVMISKGGTNQFHGDLFEYIRNSAFNARNFFDGPKVPQLEKNNFGGSFGGPIKKDKTFFYAVYEGLRENLGYSAVNTVPAVGCHTEASGAPLQPGDRVTAAACPTLGSTPSVTIPAGLAGQEVLQMLALYPIPNFTVTSGNSVVNQFRYGPSTKIGVNYGQIRFDENFSSSDIFFARYTTDSSSSDAALANGTPLNSGVSFPQFRGGGTTRNQFITASETHIFSPTLSNSLRIAFSRTGWKTFWITGDTSLAPIPSFPGGPGFLAGEPFGTFNISGLSSMGFGTIAGPANNPAFHLQNIYSLADDVYYTHGKHQFRFGTLLNRYDQALTIVLSAFEGTPSYASFANFLQGVPLTFSANLPGSDVNRFFHYNTYGFYAQDDWRVTPRLTLNLGLRYEFLGPISEQNGKSYAITNLATSTAWTPGPVMRDRTYLNFGPRFGFAWDMFGDGKTALRGGAGVYYDIGNFGGAMTGNAYVAFPALNVVFPNTTNAIFTYPYSVPTVAQALTNGTALNESQDFDYNAINPYVYQYNLTLQRQLPKNTAISIAYVGTQGEHLWQEVEGNPIQPTAILNGVPYWSINNPSCQAGTFSVAIGTLSKPTCRTNPNFGTLGNDTTSGLSNYNSLQVVVNKRMSRGLEVQGAYTYAHALSTATGQLAGINCVSGMDASVSPNEKATDWGPACTDVRHNLRFNLLYHFPNIKSNGFLAKATNGWWMGNIVSVEGGLPFTPFVATNRSDSGNRGTGIDYPNVNTQTIAAGTQLTDALGNTYNAAANFVPYDPKTVITGNPNQWFNPNMFSLQPVVPCPGTAGICNTVGNVSRGILRGPGLGAWDFSIVKDTPLHMLGEQGAIQFRAEFFNILNRTNFGSPGPAQGTGPAIFAGSSGVTPKSLYGAYSQAPNTTNEAITWTTTTARQIQFALKVIF